MAIRTTPRRTAGAAPDDGRLIAIRAQSVGKEPIEKPVLPAAAPTIIRMAMQWGYILRVRTRWNGDSDMRDSFGERAVKDLAELGIGAEALQGFASTQHIEVQLYASDATTEDGTSLLDAASEIPWEYLLSAATQYIGRLESLLVTRCIEKESAFAPGKPKTVLIVESAPGRIGQIYDFEDEEARLTAALNLEPTFSPTETLTALQTRLRERAWDVVHVTGVDTHQAAWEIEDFYPEVKKKARQDEGVNSAGGGEQGLKEEIFKHDVIDASGRLHDGMILRGDHKSEQPVRYDDFADLLIGSGKPPGVVTLNLYYSGARTARELVARGAYAALGFLDQIDDEFAELFFQGFYWAWCHGDMSIRDAFLEAWRGMDSERMHGTGIVIWSAHSMIGPAGGSPQRPTRAGKAGRGGR